MLDKAGISTILYYARVVSTAVGGTLITLFVLWLIFNAIQDSLASSFCRHNKFDDGRALSNGEIACIVYIVLPGPPPKK